jgi:energy-coupling factor transport system substrate-specific component
MSETGIRERRRSWRIVDIVSAAVIGVVGGVLLVLTNAAYGPLATAAQAGYPPLEGALTGLYVLPAVLGGLVVRRPGAATFTMLTAAVASMVVGNQWGFLTVWYGLLQGLGAELVFAVGRYRRWGVVTAGLAAVGAAVGDALLTLPLFYAGVGADQQIARVVIGMVSAALVAGVGSWLLVRSLAATGALDALPSGRAAPRV